MEFVLKEIRELGILGLKNEETTGKLLDWLDETQRFKTPELQRLYELQGGKKGYDVRLFKQFEFCRGLDLEEVWYSSGTSGSTSRTPLVTRDFYLRSIYLSIYNSPLKDLLEGVDSLLILVPPRSEWPNNSLAFMYETIGEYFSDKYEGTVVWGVEGEEVNGHPSKLRFKSGTIDWLKNQSEKKQSVGILTTSYMGVILAKEWGTDDRLTPDSFIVDTGGYKGVVGEMSREEYKGLIRSTLGLPEERIRSEYGMSEMSSQFWSEYVNGEEVWAIPEYVKVEIEDPSVNGVGQVVIHDLFNVWTTCSIRTQDLGRTFEINGKKYFQPFGRMPKAEVKGCSVTASGVYDV